MSWDNFRDIPKFFRDDQKKFKDTIKNATNFPLKLFLYDGFDEGTGTGYASKEDFIGSVLTNTNAPQYEISLNPSTSVQTEDFSIGARWIRNITDYSQREDDIVSLIYSQERPVYQIDTELDLRDKLVFFSQESIYGNLEEGEVSVRVPKDIPIFELDSYDPQYDEFGVFQYATLTLKRIVSWKAKKTATDGSGVVEYVEFNFNIANVQPINVKRVKYVFKSKPINWVYNFYDDNGNVIEHNDTPNTQGEKFITPFLPKKEGGTKLSFVPSWINEMGYWTQNYNQIVLDSRGLLSIKVNQTFTSREDGTIPIFGDNNQTVGLPSDTTNPKGLIPKHKYRTGGATFSILSGVIADRSSWFKSVSSLMDFSTPLSFFGYIRNDNFDSWDSSKNLPRREDEELSVWKTFEEETYAYGDLVSNADVLVIEQGFQFVYSDIKLNEDNTKYKEIANDILNGNATMFGQILNTKPPSQYDKDFDFSPEPNEWSLDDMKRYTGVFYIDGDEDLTNGSSQELEITAPSITTKKTERFDVSNLFNTFITMTYLSSIDIKTNKTGRDWYKDYNENWVFEVELESKVNILTRVDMKYFGGYEYTVEYFQNSYEDSLVNGDIPCEFEFFGTSYKLPALTYRASNRRGNPLSYGESKIYGSGSGESDSKNLLISANKKLVKENAKELYNVNNGSKVKNPHRKGGEK